MIRGAAWAAAALLGAAAGGAEGGRERVHVVQPGESLSQIAAALVRNQGCWPEIYRANRDQIKDPSLLHPGQKLVIPEQLDCQRPEPDELPED